jgi:nucleoside-specific outer membrane channel protein Tsx
MNAYEGIWIFPRDESMIAAFVGNDLGFGPFPSRFGAGTFANDVGASS